MSEDDRTMNLPEKVCRETARVSVLVALNLNLTGPVNKKHHLEMTDAVESGHQASGSGDITEMIIALRKLEKF